MKITFFREIIIELNQDICISFYPFHSEKNEKSKKPITERKLLLPFCFYLSSHNNRPVVVKIQKGNGEIVAEMPNNTIP